MASGDQYRERANECIEAADRSADPERKLYLLELAERWLRLAEHVDGIHDPNGLRGDALLDFPTSKARKR
jgi:hypothetical protein